MDRSSAGGARLLSFTLLTVQSGGVVLVALTQVSSRVWKKITVFTELLTEDSLSKDCSQACLFLHYSSLRMWEAREPT